MRTRLSWPAAALMLCISAPAYAVPMLDLPWPCNTSYRITQGHQVGSHTDKGAWAWDVGIGVGGELVAPADGIVRRVKNDSTRYGCDSAYGNDGNYVVLDFGDGTEALFLHLKANSILVTPGQQVRRGQKVGEVGNSGWICGTHLHFQIQNSCASWYCQSIPASFIAIGDPNAGQTVQSMNCAQPMPACKIPAQGELVIDERSSCFDRGTTGLQWWWTQQGGGHEGSWLYTYATDAQAPDSQAWWRFEASSATDYELEVHIPPGAESTQAKYLVHIGAQTHGPILIDQTAAQGWVSLGRFQIDAAQAADIYLGDNTGEPYSEQAKRRLAFDAVRIKPAVPVIEPADMGISLDMTSAPPDMSSTPLDMSTPVLDMDKAPREEMGVQDMGQVKGMEPDAERPVRIVSEGSCTSGVSPSGQPLGLTPLVALSLLYGAQRRRRRLRRQAH